MLKVMAAASAPLLISVGSGRVRRGASSSPTGTPVIVGRCDDTSEIVVAGCVGRAILLEKTCEVKELDGAEEVGDLEDLGDLRESGDVVELGRDDVTTVVDVDRLAICGGAIAPMPWDVGV